MARKPKEKEETPADSIAFETDMEGIDESILDTEPIEIVEPIAEEEPDEEPEEGTAKVEVAEVEVTEPSEAADEGDSAPQAKLPKRSSVAAQKEAERRQRNIQRRNDEAERIAQAAARQEFYTGIKSLQEAERTHRIINGQIISVESVSTEGTNASARVVTMFGVLVDDRFKVLIPFEEFFRDNPIDMNTVDLNSGEGLRNYRRRQRQMAEKMYGIVVPIVITNVFVSDMDDYSISASRRLALEILERQNYLPSRGAEPRVQEGDFVDAEILSVGFYNLFVHVNGVDTSIPLWDLTFRYVRTLAEFYRVGDKIPVQIREITTNKDGRIKIRVNARATELLKAKRQQQTGFISVGTQTIGVITAINPSKKNPGRVVVLAYLPYFKMPAILTSFDPGTLAFKPKAGDQMRLHVRGFTDSGFVVASCHGFHNASGLLGRG